MYRKFIVSIFISLTTLMAFSQNGNIRGTVFDLNTGELLPGVTIFAEGTSAGTITDLDGKFSLSIPAGTYKLRISFISYETLILKEVKVDADEITILDNLGLETANIDIEEVVITAQTIRNTENSLISLKRKSPNMMDGISATNLRKIGDSDAASSMKRVSGVSVSGGKYVFVRGLGDRYTKTILNGMDIPGLDPDRNTIQMDLFPTSIINNIIVHKSFSADLPADFTGGVIDIEIKDFPSKKEASISLGTGYNPNYHFNSNYIGYQGGNTDFLGFDNGSRAIPAISNIPSFGEAYVNPNGEAGLRYKEILNSFNPIMGTTKKMSLMDMSMSASYGNQIEKKGYRLGYTFAVSYKNNTEFYANTIDERWGMSSNLSTFDLEARESQKGSLGVNNVFLTGLAGIAYKTNYSKIRLYLLHLQNGESQAGFFDFVGSDQGSDFVSEQYTLDYNQRALSNILLDGKHKLDDSKWEIEWKISPTLSRIVSPDVRFTRYEVNGDGSKEIGTEVGFPERIWRNLTEINAANLARASRDFDFLGHKSKLKFGAAYTFKYREYSIQKFLLNIRGGNDGNVPLTGDPNELFSEELLWPYQGNLLYGTTYENEQNKSLSYNANVNYIAGYVSADLTILNNLKANIGLRIEKYDQRYTGENQSGSEILSNNKVLNDLDLFPSINIIYNPYERMNLRASYSKTIARPSMKELSYAEIYDPISGKTFIGGMNQDKDNEGNIYWDGNLLSTDIQNMDLRIERFGGSGQMISLSAFYKIFENPIELVQFAKQIGAFQPRNVGDGSVLGAEFEIRQNFKFISENLAGLSFNSNITLTQSQIKMSGTEYNSRIENARTGQLIAKYRDMAGQAPYIVNAGLAFAGKNGIFANLEAGIYYNVQGMTLQYVGITDRPDIYSLPFHSLNFNSNVNLGKNHRVKLGLKVSNILNEDKEYVYQSYNITETYYSEYRAKGISFSLSLGYNFH